MISRPFIFTGLLLLTLLYGCSKNHPDSAKTNEQAIHKADIKGTWYLNQWTMFHTLIFSDTTLLMDNHIDTVFTVDYTIVQDTLVVQEPVKTHKNKIIHLTKDTLVVEGIGNSKGRRSYSRIKKPY